jgi:hypothetical protein
MSTLSTLLPRFRRALAPLLLGAFGCALWLHFHVHLGLIQRFEVATHDRFELTELQLLLALWLTATAAAAAAPPAIRRVPLPDPAWTAARPFTIEDRLAAACFGAYGANRTASTVEPGGVAFRELGPLVLALGGPPGDPARAHAAQEAFRRWAGRRPLVWYGTGTGGPGSFPIGQEAIVRPARHDLATPRLANLRHSLARARRAGVEVVRGPWSGLPADLREQVAELARTTRRRRRFALRLTVSELADARDGRTWALGVCDGRVEAALTWLPACGEPGLVLDILWRRPDAVPGSVELLIEDGIDRARSAGFGYVSLGVCGEARQPAWLQRLNPPGLRRFKDKFAPEWHDRFIVAPAMPRPLALAAVAMGHLAPARSGLPS